MAAVVVKGSPEAAEAVTGAPDEDTSLDEVVDRVDGVAELVTSIEAMLSGVLCVSLSCMSTVLNVVSISSICGVVDIPASPVVSGPCIAFDVVVCVAASPGADVTISVTG